VVCSPFHLQPSDAVGREGGELQEIGQHHWEQDRALGCRRGMLSRAKEYSVSQEREREREWTLGSLCTGTVRLALL
jgi:hypothetical protein